jgi:hypothetical protein
MAAPLIGYTKQQQRTVIPIIEKFAEDEVHFGDKFMIHRKCYEWWKDSMEG